MYKAEGHGLDVRFDRVVTARTEAGLGMTLFELFHDHDSRRGLWRTEVRRDT